MTSSLSNSPPVSAASTRRRSREGDLDRPRKFLQPGPSAPSPRSSLATAPLASRLHGELLDYSPHNPPLS
jgi:hypothetical protein